MSCRMSESIIESLMGWYGHVKRLDGEKFGRLLYRRGVDAVRGADDNGMNGLMVRDSVLVREG